MGTYRFSFTPDTDDSVDGAEVLITLKTKDPHIKAPVRAFAQLLSGMTFADASIRKYLDIE